jgi:hypothetical protein
MLEFLLLQFSTTTNATPSSGGDITTALKTLLPSNADIEASTVCKLMGMQVSILSSYGAKSYNIEVSAAASCVIARALRLACQLNLDGSCPGSGMT